MNGETEYAASMTAIEWSDWLPLVNVVASIILAAAALWSLRTANQIAATKNPAPYGQLRIMWILERLVRSLEVGDYDNAKIHVKNLSQHFYNHSARAIAEGKNTESGDWYFVWDAERAFSEFVRVTNGESDGVRMVGNFASDMDGEKAIEAAKAMLKIQLELIDKIHKG